MQRRLAPAETVYAANFGAGTMVVGSSLPQISIDELAPALNPCKPIIIQTETAGAASWVVFVVCHRPWHLALQKSDN